MWLHRYCEHHEEVILIPHEQLMAKHLRVNYGMRRIHAPGTAVPHSINLALSSVFKSKPALKIPIISKNSDFGSLSPLYKQVFRSNLSILNFSSTKSNHSIPIAVATRPRFSPIHF